MRPCSIRWRITLWYGAMMAILIAAFGVAVVGMTVQRYSARVDFELTEEMSELELEFRDETSRNELLRELKAGFASHADYEFEILLEDGTPFFRSERLGETSLLPGHRPQWPDRSAGADTMRLPMGDYRVLRKPVESPFGRMLIQAAIPLRHVREAETELLIVAGWLGPLMVLPALLGGYWMAGRMLVPIQNITETARQISAQRLKNRIAVPPADDELNLLARTLNDMFDRLDHAFDEMRRFTADAAHELRTPLAVMRTQLDVALRTERSAEAYQAVLQSLLEDVVRMSHLASQLLELSREDADLIMSVQDRVAIHDLITDVLSQMRAVAAAKKLSVELCALPHLEVTGDAERLRRVFLNLFDNAVKYTPAGGVISVNVTSDASLVRVTISDSGPGIPDRYLPAVFERFFRADPSRSSPQGTGLGLAICRAIVTAHGGEITLSCPPTGGTVVSVSLPRISDAG